MSKPIKGEISIAARRGRSIDRRGKDGDGCGCRKCDRILNCVVAPAESPARMIYGREYSQFQYFQKASL